MTRSRDREIAKRLEGPASPTRTNDREFSYARAFEVYVVRVLFSQCLFYVSKVSLSIDPENETIHYLRVGYCAPGYQR